MNRNQLATSLRNKYPEYNNTPDDILIDGLLKKYPEYKDVLTDEPQVPKIDIPYATTESSSTAVDFSTPQTQVAKIINTAGRDLSIGPKPDEPDEGFWKGLKRTLERSSIQKSGEIVGTVSNILGTTSPRKAETRDLKDKTGKPIYSSAQLRGDIAPGSPMYSTIKEYIPEITKEEAKKKTEESPLFQYGNEIREVTKNYIESREDLKDPENMVELSWGTILNPSVMGRAIGEGIPSILAIIGSGTVATVATGNPIVGTVTAMSMGGLLEGSGAYTTAKEYGKLDYEEQARVGMLVGTINGMISAIPGYTFLKGFGPTFQKELSRKIIEKGLFKPIAQDVLIQGISEAVEETLQEGVSIVGEMSYMDKVDQPTKEQILNRIGASAYGGFLLGKGTGAVGHTGTVAKYPGSELQTTRKITKSVQKAEKEGGMEDNIAYQEVVRAEQEGEIDTDTANYMKYFINQNPDFDGKTVVEITDKARFLVKDQMIKDRMDKGMSKEEATKDAEQFLKNEEVDESKELYSIAGATSGVEVDGIKKVLLNLYSGADKNTVVEEMYGTFYRYLTPEEKAVVEKEFLEKNPGASVDQNALQEWFEKRGTEYFFEAQPGLQKNAFEKALLKVKNLIKKVGRSANQVSPLKTKELFELKAVKGFKGEISEDTDETFEVRPVRPVREVELENMGLEPVKGGVYIDPITKKPYKTGTSYNQGNIDVSGKFPKFSLDDVETESATKESGYRTHTNLYREKTRNGLRLWTWLGDQSKKPESGTIVSVDTRGKHYYSLSTDYGTPITLSTFPNKKDEPRLRPTSYGELEFGNQIGKIKTSGGKIHPVYDKITIKDKRDTDESFQLVPVVAKRLANRRKISENRKVSTAVRRGLTELLEVISDPNFDIDGATDWYRGAVDETINIASKEIPELQDPNDEVIFKGILASTSLGTKLDPNYHQAIEAMKDFVKDGKLRYGQSTSGKSTLLLTRNKDGKEIATRRDGISNNTIFIEKLIEKYGKQGAVDWLLNSHNGYEIKEVFEELTGRKLGGHILINKKKPKQYYGGMAFGPKIGRYFLNLNGIHSEAVYDLWWSRTWNRWMGTPFDKDGKLQETPRGNAERSLMDDAINQMANKLNKQLGTNLEVDQIQALLWYYEKELYIKNDVTIPKGMNYADVAIQRAKDKGYYEPTTSKSVRESQETQRTGITGSQEQGISDKSPKRRATKSRKADQKEDSETYQLKPFYSPATKAVENPRFGKSKQVQGILPYLKNQQVKDDEIKWLGLREWLSDKKGKVSKEELLDFLNKNEVTVTETMLTDAKATAELMSDKKLRRWEVLDFIFETEGGFTDEQNKEYTELTKDIIEKYNLEIDFDQDEGGVNTIRSLYSPKNLTKFTEWTLEGDKKDQRELVLTFNPKPKLTDLPEGYKVEKDGDFYYVRNGEKNGEFRGDTPEQAIETALQVLNEDNGSSYTVPSAHSYGDPKLDINRLAMVRFNTRYDTEGNKVLFIDEIQSDWHQTGEKKGYVKSKEIPEGWKVKSVEHNIYPNTETWYHMYKDGNEIGGIQVKDVGQGEKAILKELKEQAIKSIDKYGLPDAPYKGNEWLKFSLKRMLRYGAENGFDKIAWTTGEQQSQRYDLSKHIDRIEYMAPVFNSKDPVYSDRGFDLNRYSVKAYDLNGVEVLNKFFTEKELEDNLGKTVAQRIVNREGDKMGWYYNKSTGEYTTYKLSGLNLVNDEKGMKVFYNQKIPNILKKYFRKNKWDSKVEVLELNMGNKGLLSVGTEDGPIKGVDSFRNLEMFLTESSKAPDTLAYDGISISIGDKKNAYTIIYDEDGGFVEIQSTVDKELHMRSYELDFEIDEKFAGDIVINKEGITWEENYEEIIKDVFNDIKRSAEKYIEDGTIKYTSKQLSARITPDMKESVMMGQESFQLKSVEEMPFEIGESYSELMGRKVVDKLNRLKKVQTIIGEVPEEMDAYLEAEMFIGRASEKLRVFEEYEDDLTKRIVDNYSMVDFGDYLYALHAPERNEKLRNEFPERWDEDSSPSGMSDIEAENIIKKYKGDKTIKKLAKEFKTNVIDKNLQALLDGEMITEEVYETLVNTYDNYVPLKGIDTQEIFGGTGKGFSTQGKDIKRAYGRESRAKNPYVNSLVDFRTSIIRVEKNKVGQALYNLVLENPNDNYWKASGLKYKPRYNQEGEIEFMDPEQVGIHDFIVRVDGKIKKIVIKDPALLSGLKNLGAGAGIPILQQANSYFRAVNTYFNPEFLITNFERDVQSAGIVLSGEQSSKITGQVMKNIPSAMKGIWKSNRKKDPNEWSDLYDNFKAVGGKMGWFDNLTLEQKVKQLERKIKLSGKSGVKQVKAVGQFIEDVNDVVESAVRLSTYKAMLDAGMTEKQSASVAKNLTVNFNKKGEWGSIINSLWLFANAGIQGSARIYDAFKHKRVKAIAGGLVSLGFLSSFINRAIDDDEWDQTDDIIKDGNWIVLLPNGKSVTMRVPYGWGTFKNIGGIAEEVMFGDTDIAEGSSRIFKSVVDGFIPLSGGSFSQFLLPTVADPIVQITENKAWHGGPIMPEQPQFSPKKPDAELYFKSARPMSVKVAKDLRQKTTGKIDVSPETLDHIIDTFGGGTGRFLANTLQSGKSVISGEELELANVPFLRAKLRSSKSEYKARNIVYNMLNESARKVYSKEDKAKFLKYLRFMVKDKHITRSKAKEHKEDFNKNQKKARESFK